MALTLQKGGNLSLPKTDPRLTGTEFELDAGALANGHGMNF